MAQDNLKEPLTKGVRRRVPEPLSRSFQDYESHFIAYLIDVNFCLIPVYLWVVLFLMILSGAISPYYFNTSLYVMYGFLFFFSFVVNPLLCVYWKGQTLGGRLAGIRLISDKLTYANPFLLILRQILGLGVPIMIFGYFFSFIGLALWWAINGLVVLISPHQRTIFDWLLHLEPARAKAYEFSFSRKDYLVQEDDEESGIEVKASNLRKAINQQIEAANAAKESEAAEKESLKKEKAKEKKAEKARKKAARKAAQGKEKTTGTKTPAKTRKKAKPASNQPARSPKPAMQAQPASAKAPQVKQVVVSKVKEPLDITPYLEAFNPPEIKSTKKPIQSSHSRTSPIDLHIRSDFSDDAKSSVESIFTQAKQKGIRTISITDHNSAKANGVAMAVLDEYKLNYITGVEIDAQTAGKRVRILGYYINYKDPYYQKMEAQALKREKNASIQRARKFMQHTGVQIDIEQILSHSRFKKLSPVMLTRLVFEEPEIRKQDFVQHYLRSRSEQEARTLFYQDFFGQGGLCDVTVTYPEADEVIEAIHASHGLAVLSNWNLEELKGLDYRELVAVGLDGVELFTPNASLRTQKVLLSLIDSSKLLVTAGSDYHGDGRADRQLGEFAIPDKGLQLVELFTKSRRN